jgi:glutamate/tyrosine decarboxylase-like PLP-dependent enzyme
MSETTKNEQERLNAADSGDGAAASTRPSSRASSLDLPADVWRQFAKEAQAFVDDYLSQINELPIFPQSSSTNIADHLPVQLPVDGASVEQVFAECRAIRDLCRHSGSPRFFGYVQSPATPVGIIGDYVASALNQNLTAWRSTPGATDIERMVVRWLGQLVGYGDQAGGLLVSGGSMANLDALYIAHRAKSSAQVSQTGLWKSERPMTIYASDQVHLSIEKAADVLGLGRQQVRLIETDNHYRLDIRNLRERVAGDLRDGLQPFCVVGSAGTVNTGAIDPLAEIAAVARERDLWFHIDGAYGALGALDPKMKQSFNGIELADSVSLDPHKWLYAPIDTGCLLLNDPSLARSAYSSAEADYIKVYEENERESFAFWDYGIELTRRFRALKIWMMLRYYGAARIAEAISEDIALARYFAERVDAADDFELMAPSDLSICCFRYLPSDWKRRIQDAGETQREGLQSVVDGLNERIMQRVQRGGRAYLSNATLRGRFAMRACIVNFRTTRADVDMTLDVIRDAAREIDE